MLVVVMVYMLMFGGIDLRLFKWTKDEVEHIAIVEQGDGYTIYKNSDGSNTLEMTMETPEEESLVSIEDDVYDYKSVDENSDIYFNPDFKAGEPSIKIDRAGIKVEMSPVVKTTNVVSKADGFNKNVGTYEKLYSIDAFGKGIDLEYTPITGGVKENIILNAPTDINEFNYILKVENLTVELTVNNIILRNFDREEKYIISAPVMFDKKGVESNNIRLVLEEITDTEYKVTIIPDKDWIKDSTRKYPIVIDPTIIRNNTSTVYDTFVNNVSYLRDYNYNTAHDIYVGINNSGNIYRTYLDFNMPSSLPNKIIISKAELSIYNPDSTGVGLNVALYEPNSTWSESTLTWNNQPGYGAKYAGSDKMINGPSTNRINATAYAMDIFPDGEYVGNTANKGVVIRARDESQQYGSFLKKFDSSEGASGSVKLEITYNVPISMDAPAVTVYGNGANSKDGYVELSWNVVPDATGYYVGIFNGDEYQLVDVNNVTSWSTQNKKIWPSKSQMDSGIYKLRVNANGNPLGNAGGGDELYIFPHLAYWNAPGYTVDPDNIDTNYHFIVIPHNTYGYMTVPSMCGKATVKLPDTIEPYTPSSLTMDPSSWSNANSHTVTWAGVQDYNGTDLVTTNIGDIEYTIESETVTTVSGAATWNSTGEVDGDSNYSIDTSTLTDGTYTVFQRTIDTAGNTSDIAYDNIYIDRTDPTIGAGGFVSDAVNWVDADNVTFTYDTISDDTSGVVTAQIFQGLSYIGDVDTVLTTYSLDTSSVTYNESLYILHIKDNAGNETTVDTYVRIDKEAPHVDITSPIDASNVNGIVEIWGTCTDGQYESMNSYLLEVLRYDSSNNYIETKTLKSGTNSYYSSEIIDIIDTSQYDQGDILEIYLKATDKVGKTTEETVTVTVDKSVALLDDVIQITTPVNGGVADTELEQIVYTRDASAIGTLDTINFFVDGSLFTTIPAGDVFFETLRYEETSQHSVALIGVNSGDDFEYSQGIAERIAISSTVDAGDISSSDNITFTSSGIELTNPALTGNVVFNPITLNTNDLTYLVNASSTTPVGTSVAVEVSFDNGAFWTSINNNEDFILDNDSTSMLVRLTLTGDGANSPRVMGTQVKCANIQNPYNLTAQTVKPVEGLKVASNTLRRVTIGWNGSFDPDVKYDVYRGATSNFTPSDSNRVFSQSTSTAYADTSVNPGTKYYYKVVATKSYPVVSPYIPFRESQAKTISVTAYKTPVYTDDGDDDDGVTWGNEDEIEASSNVNDLYGGNWTVNNELAPPEGASEMNESMLGARTFCAAGFEPINFVSGNFFMNQLDATYSVMPDINSSILRTYNTQSDEDNGPLGNGWSWYYSMHLKMYNTGDVGMIQKDGHLAMFRIQLDGTYLSDEDELMTLRKTIDEYIVENQNGEQIVFDSGGQLKRIVSENGNTSEVKYDDRGVIDKVVYSTGKVLDVTADTNGHITIITMPDGRKVYYEYEGNNLVKYYDVAGDATVYEYDDAGRMVAWYDKKGERQVYNVYDDEDRVVEQWDANEYYYQLEYRDNSVLTTDGQGDSKEYFFDKIGRTTKIVDTEGYSQEYEYNTNSQVVKYRDKLGMVTRYEYDSNDNLVKEITNDNRVRNYTYDENNNLTGETDYLGNWTVYEYDSSNNLVKRTYPDGSNYLYEYNDDNQLVKLTNPMGDSELYEYDGEVMVGHTDALGSVTRYEYNDRDELAKLVDANNNVSKMEYNVSGNIVKTILPDNTEMSYEYDAMDNMVSFTDAKGQVTKFEYDALGHMTKTINPDGSEIRYEYDGNGNMVKTIYPDGTYIVNTYDSNNNLISTVDQDGKTYKMAYNPVGDVLNITEPNSTVSKLEYSDKNGWLAKSIDGDNAETMYEYDANGNVVKMTYTDGTTTQFTYDSMGRIKTQKLNNGAVTTYNYNVLGQLESVVDAMGNATWYVYDKLGQMIQVVDSLGNRTNFEYDAIGNMISMTDANGEKIEYSYDATSQLEKIIAPLGGAVEYNYDPNGQLEKVVNALGGSADNVYDEMGRVVKSTDLLGAETTYEYDIVGNMVKETNALGNSFNYEYDANGNIIKITDSLDNEAKFQYDVMSNITKIEGEEGYVEEYEYDKLNRVVKTVDSEGYEKYYEYDEMGRLSKESDNTDKSILYTYTTIGQVKTITNAKGEKTELFYDLNGNTTKVLCADGTSETYSYNELNELVRQYDRVGLETTYTYDSVGNVVESKQPSNKIYKYEYDANYNLIKEINPEGGETTYTYDDGGNAISVTDPMGNTTKIEYNNASMIEKVVDAKGVQTLKVDYSILGEVLKETDALGNVTNYKYDELSRLVTVIDPLNRMTNYKYDGADNIVSVIDANNNIVNYEYNTMGLLTKETDALGNVESYSYYVDGLLEQITKADETTSTYSYDVAGRMTDVVYSDGTSINYGHNEIGLVTNMKDSTGITTYQYDDMQRLISTNDSNDKTVSYEYDILGRKTSITLPDNQKVSYEYDVMDRMTGVFEDGNKVASYEYNRLSQLTSNTRDNIVTTYEYNKLGQITELTTSDINSQIQKFTYQYDVVGNIVEEVRSEGDTQNIRNYTYDSANQLTKFTDNDYTEIYTYNNVGNMIDKNINGESTLYTYNKGNQLVTETIKEKTIEYIYNQNGDLISKSTGEQYKYDIQGNLTSIKGNGLDKEYTYNAVGSRLSESTNGVVTYYVNDLNRTYEQVLQTYNKDDNTNNTYTYGVQRISSKGQTNETYLYDGRGSVVGSVGNDNNVVTYAYTAYGELMPNSPTPNIFGYNGEQTDYSTGIQYLRARYYDTRINRFFQEDDYRGDFRNPISTNRYIYTHNNPVMEIDPSGYSSISNLDRKIASMKPRQLIDGGNPNYWASEEYRNRKIRTPEEYYRDSRVTEVGSNGVPNSINQQNANITYDDANCGAYSIDSFEELDAIIKDGMDFSVYSEGELYHLYNKVASYREQGYDFTNVQYDEFLLLHTFDEAFYERDRMNKARKDFYDQQEMHNEIIEMNSHLEYDDPEQPSVYYEDFTFSIKVVDIGRTKVINLEEKYVSYHNHIGISSPSDWLKLALPFTAKVSTGTVKGDVSEPMNYNGFFADLALYLLVGIEGSHGFMPGDGYLKEFFGGKLGEVSEDRVTQEGGGIKGGAGLSGGVSYYWGDREYYIDD